MNCFHHQETAAVASCKQCSKGLCAACAVDLGHGVACSGHVREIEGIQALMQQAGANLSTGTRFKYLSPLLVGGFGALFFFYGLFSFNKGSSFAMTLGAATMVCALVLLVVVRSASTAQTPRA